MLDFSCWIEVIRSLPGGCAVAVSAVANETTPAASTAAAPATDFRVFIDFLQEQQIRIDWRKLSEIARFH
jgi:hypothetical protein